MAIQWYPGHMKAARKEIAQAMRSTDVVLEVLDARMPRSSSNPALTESRRGKPCLKLLAKSDLADPQATRAWLTWLEEQAPECRALELSLTRARASDLRSKLVEACKSLAPQRSTKARHLQVLVVGVPNVGKSTLMNVLMDRKVARTRDQPGLTRTAQIAQLSDGTIVSDTAGILWSDIEEAAALRLALCGSVPESEFDYETLGHFAATFLLERYPGPVCARFELTTPPDAPEELLDRIGRRYGGLRAGGKVDLTKAGSVLVHEFRAGKLGRISLEHPRDSLAINA